jgi:hypothetical protein
MKYWILILTPTFLLTTAPDIQAHNQAIVKTQDYQHVYRRQQYGKPLQQGQLFRAPGGGSMILWRPGTRSDYGKLNAGRSGPIIGGQNLQPGVKPKRSKKYGTPIYSYGKQ